MTRKISVVVLMIAALMLASCSGNQSAPSKSEPAKSQPTDSQPAKPEPTKPAWKPTKTMEMTVLFGAGSASDLIARSLADGLTKELGQTMTVVNRTGGGGALGYNHVKSQPADGYALVWNSNSISTVYYAGNMKITHNDFDAVSRVSVEAGDLAVRADGPFKTVNDLIEHAKKNPGKVKIGNSGIGTYTHLVAVAFAKAAGIQVVHVPATQGVALSNLLGGQLDASVQLPGEVMSQVKGGTVRILGIAGEVRDPNLPDVPTLKEQKLDVVMELWRGIAVPKGTPREVIQAMDAAIKKIVESSAFHEQSKTLVFRPAYLPADAFAKQIADDDKKIAEMMTELGLNRVSK